MSPPSVGEDDASPPQSAKASLESHNLRVGLNESWLDKLLAQGVTIQRVRVKVQEF